METFQERLRRVVQETVSIVPYDPVWPEKFEYEKQHLLSCLPDKLITRIEHFGSTAVPNLWAKPIIDMLVEVTSLEKTKSEIVPVLQAQNYDYFWRPSWGDDIPPYYAWFIKRDSGGNRTHHIHMVEKDFEHWDRLLFRDYLREHPETAMVYQSLKINIAERNASDRIAYTNSKAGFISEITKRAKEEYYSR
ncbi:GrpB family protein [Fibrobacterota bacterium]